MIPALTSIQRRARCDPWFLKGLKSQLPFNRVYKQMLALGTSYRRTEMLRRWHDLEGFSATIDVIETMYVDKPIPDVRHLYPKGDIGDSYRYRTMSTLRHRDTGEEIEEPFTVLSDAPLTWDEILDDVKNFIKRYPYLDDYDIVETHLTEAMKQEG